MKKRLKSLLIQQQSLSEQYIEQKSNGRPTQIAQQYNKSKHQEKVDLTLKETLPSPAKTQSTKAMTDRHKPHTTLRQEQSQHKVNLVPLKKNPASHNASRTEAKIRHHKAADASYKSDIPGSQKHEQVYFYGEEDSTRAKKKGREQNPR